MLINLCALVTNETYLFPLNIFAASLNIHLLLGLLTREERGKRDLSIIGLQSSKQTNTSPAPLFANVDLPLTN